MKILMVLDEEFPPDVRVEKEINALQSAGHTVHLLCYSRAGRSEAISQNGIKIFRIPISPLHYKFKALALQLPFYFKYWKKHIRQLLEKESYDVIHFHDLPLAEVCITLGRENGIPVVGDYHENRPEIMKFYHHVRSFPGNVLISVKKWAAYQAKYTRLLDHLILVTPEAKDYYSGHYGVEEDKITVVENFPDLNELLHYEADESIQRKYKGKKMLIYFGDTGLRRGTGTILEAAIRLKDNPEYCFVIIGSSREQNTLLDMKDRNGLHNVELTGILSLREAVSYFRSAFAGLCPLLRNIHHDTTYANKLFQYMAFGLPVVVSNCTAQEAVVRDAACGLVHEAGDADDLVKKIGMLSKGDVWGEMSINAEKAVKINYNFTVAGKKLLNLYDAINNEHY